MADALLAGITVTNFAVDEMLPAGVYTRSFHPVEMTIGQIVECLAGTLINGDADMVVTGIAGYDTVLPGQITFITQARFLPLAEASSAEAIIAPHAITESSKPLICVDDPRSAFASILTIFDWREIAPPGIHPSAVVAETAQIAESAVICPHVVIGEGAVIGEGCVLHAQVTIGHHVEIAAGSILYPHVTIYPHCSIGQKCILHSGVVIGADGHGFQPSAEGWQKLPHLGRVEIGNNVEIGANSTIDRATTGITSIGDGCKIDNLVMIAHNVVMGRQCMILSLAGIAGSCNIEDNVVIAGQVGLRDHINIGKGARLIARAGITQNIPAGATISGYPAQNHTEELKYQATLHRVPEMMTTIKDLQKQLAEMQEKIEKLTDKDQEK